MKQCNIDTEGKETNNSRKNILKINSNARQDFAHNNVKCTVRNRKKMQVIVDFFAKRRVSFLCRYSCACVCMRFTQRTF